MIGLKLKEVAHDIQMQVTKYVEKELKMVNSFDTWHGNNDIITLLDVIKF
jgi:hypothetical protein